MWANVDVAHAGGAAWRRRQRQLRAHWRHEQLTLQMLLATYNHHAATTARSGGGKSACQTTRPSPELCLPLPPEAAGAQFFAMTLDEEEKAPAASRPAPMEEVRPPGQDGRHCGSGYELVLDATVPRLRLGVDEPGMVECGRNYELIARFFDVKFGRRPVQEIREVQAARDPGERVPQLRKVTPQKQISERIPERIVERGIPQERLLERILEQIVEHGIPQERITERITKQIVGRGIPQKRTSERITKQIVGRGIPQERTSERTMEQNVDFPVLAIPLERISERIAGQIVDGVPEPTGRGTSSSSAAALGAAECPNYGVLRTFPQKKKSATPRPESSAGVLGQSSSWTRAACELGQSSTEGEDPDVWIDEHGRRWWRLDTAPGRWYLGGSNKTIFWDPPGWAVVEDTPVVGAAHCGVQVCCLPPHTDRPVCREEDVLQTLSLDTYGGWSAQVWMGFSLTDAYGQVCVESKLSKHCAVLYAAEDCARRRTSLLLSVEVRCQGSSGPLLGIGVVFWDVPSNGSS